jgi:hypothetical protein
MQGYLNNNQIEYILFHLAYRFQITDEIRSRISFTRNEAGQERDSGRIVIQLSDQSLDEEGIIKINDIPILFPLGKEEVNYEWKNNSLVFNHDLFKSAFYLLSGYQEFRSEKRDHYGRFPFDESIQKKLQIIQKPLVNYYFDIIASGIEEFCKKYSIEFRPVSIFNTMGFMLSHDVDIIDTYTFRDVLFRLKEVIIPSKTKYPLQKRIHYFLKYAINYANFFKRKNNHWDFDYLVDSAKKRGFKSVFYFLHKEVRKNDSKYRFSDKRIRNLFQFLKKENCEIGLHGSTLSATDQGILKKHLDKLELYSEMPVSGIRQHRLIHMQFHTARLQYEAGLRYDSTLGFAEHEGFRNSYCLPFKLYDFEKDEMLNIWQIPLIVMDATIFMYRKLDLKSAQESIVTLIEQCLKFNGLFTLLWHNGNFDEEFYPYGRELYEGILNTVKQQSPQSIRGDEWIEISAKGDFPFRGLEM